MPPAHYTVIFDASCGFCQQQVRWLRALDWRKALRLQSYPLVRRVVELYRLGGVTPMALHDSPMQHPCIRITRMAATIACLFFLPAVVFSPNPDSSLGMPWPAFFGTWGVMLLAAFISFMGYLACRSRGVPVSAFYVIFPLVLFGGLLIFRNLHAIARALAS